MRTLGLLAAAVALLGFSMPVAAADPTPEPGYDATTYLIGRCWSPGQPVEQEPTQVVYNCDGSSIMENMAWTSWGADATGTGMDNSAACEPSCAAGTRLRNPIVVHAWNPKPADGCPPNLQFFSEMTIAYPKDVPPWINPGTEWSSDTLFATIDGMPAVHYINQAPLTCAAPLH